MTKIKRMLLAIIMLFCFSLTSYPVLAVVKVGTLIFHPPFVMSAGTGFDLDMIRIVFQRMQESYQLIPMNFNHLFTALDEGKIDIAVGAITISSRREQNYIFSLPYMLSQSQFLVLKRNNIKTMADLKGKKVGVIRGEKEGSAMYHYLIGTYPTLLKVIRFDDVEDVITALNKGKIKAAFINAHVAAYWEQNGGNQFILFGKPVTLGHGLGIMALPTNAALINRINQQLQVLEKSEAYLNLYKMYFRD